MKVRVSERQTFKRCRKRWDYSSPSRQNLMPVGNPMPLQFGSMIHKTLELWAEDEAQDPVQLFTHTASLELEEMKKSYKVNVGVAPSPKELDSYYEHVDLGLDMIANYKTMWGSPIPDGFRLVQSEQTMLLQVPGTDHELQGSLDGLLVDDRDNYYILERKTYGSRPRIDVLNSNDQFLAYCWALDQLLDGRGRVGGVVYDGLWKRKLERKRTLDQLFYRTVLLRPQVEIEQFGRYLKEELEDMADPNVRIYLNRQWLGCFDCPFDRLCTAESRGEDVEQVRRNYMVRPANADLSEEVEEDHIVGSLND